MATKAAEHGDGEMWLARDSDGSLRLFLGDPVLSSLTDNEHEWDLPNTGRMMSVPSNLYPEILVTCKQRVATTGLVVAGLSKKK